MKKHLISMLLPNHANYGNEADQQKPETSKEMRRNVMMRRFSAIVLVLAMLVGILPVMAFAVEQDSGENEFVQASLEAASEAASEEAPELAAAPTTSPVRVTFHCTPAETLVWVYEAEDEDTELEPEEDGSFLLAPGAYTYVAFCEGYTGVYEDIIIGDEEETIEVEVMLSKDAGFENENVSDSTSHQADVNYASSLSSSEVTAKLDQQKSKYYEGYVSGIQCYQFARNLAKAVFGSYPGNPCYISEGYDSNGWNMIRNPSASSVVLEPGDIIDCRYIYNSDGGTTGHTAIVWKIVDGQVYIAESWGSQNGRVHWGRMENRSNATTFAAILEIYSAKFGAENIYIFKRPGAENSPGSYLSKCTYYPAYLDIKTTKTLHEVWSLPCSDKTDPESKVIYNTSNTLTATALYKNSVTTEAHYWYRVSLPDGQTGYVYAPYCEVVNYHENDIKNGITYTGKAIPTTWTIGKSFDVDWTILSSHADFTSITGYIGSYGGTKSFSQTAKVRSQNLYRTNVDTSMKFGQITTPGNYALTIKAKVTNYYCEKGSNKLTSKTLEKTVINATIAFVEGGHTHSYSSTVVAPTCTEQGYTQHTCSCGASYKDNYTAAKGHTWKSGTITVAPSCTAPGERVDTCGVCSATNKVTLDALGHNYTETVIAGSCTQRPAKKYDCSRCGDSYTELDEGSWSDWSTEYPSGYSEDDIEVKVQYRYRDKETTTSSSSTLDGWTPSGTETVWSDYGEWSAWSTTAITASDSTQVESATVYGYYYYLCPNCGDHMHGYGSCYTWAGGCGASTNSSGWRSCWSALSWDNANLQEWYGTGKYYTTKLDGGIWFKWSDNGTPRTGYRYRTRTQSTVNSFYRWSEWSEWLDTKTESTNTREVEVREVYRYNIYAKGQHSWDTGTVTTQPTCTEEGEKRFTCNACGETEIRKVDALGHSYSYKVTKEPTVSATGTLTGTCSKCSGTTTVTLPMLNTTDYTYSVIKEPSYTATGTGRYTWKTTTYGTFNFDVTLDKLTATLTKIEIASNPNKTVYEIGEALDTTGLSLKATYSDGSAKTITSGFTTSGFDSSSAGEKTVTVTFSGKTATFAVTVVKAEEIDPNAPQIVVDTVTATAGDTVTVAVKLQNNPGFGGMAYDVTYDNTVLELVSYALDLGGGICTDSGADTYPNRINFQYAGTANVTGDGVLVTLTFKVKDTAASGFTAIRVVPTDGTVFGYDGRAEVDFDLTPVNGGIEIIDYLKGDINGDGKVNNRDAARLMQYLAGWDVDYVAAALDVNDDGKVNNRDAARLLQYLAGWDVEIH